MDLRKNLTCLNDQEISTLLETSDNKQGYDFLKRIQKSSQNLYAFEETLRSLYPNAPVGQGRAEKLVQQFFQEYTNQKRKTYMQISRMEDFNALDTLYRKFGSSFECLQCSEVNNFLSKKEIMKHVKTHRENLVKTAAEDALSWKDYQTEPFVISGLTNPRPRMFRGKTRQEIEKERLISKENISALQKRIKELEEEKSKNRSADIISQSPSNNSHHIHSNIEPDEEERNSNDTSYDSYDSEKENCEPIFNSPQIAMTPGTTIYRLDRQSSLTESGKHATKYVLNPNAKGGFVKSKAILVEATSRKSKTVEKSKRTLRNNAGKVDDFTTEICRNTPANKTEVISKIIDKQSPEDVAEISSSSKAINETNKISDEAGAALAIDFTQNQLRKIRRAGNNQLKRFLPSEEKINKAKRKRLGSLVSGDYVINDIQLQIRREGKEKKVLNLCGVVYVRNYKEFVTKVIAHELTEIEPKTLPDGVREIEIGIAGDSGGGSMKITMSLMNRIDTKVKLHILLMYEAADTKMNNIRTFSLLTEEIKALNGDTIVVEGNTFRIKQKGMFDLSAQDDIVGKQNSSSSYPCTKCTVTLSHLQNHGGREHSSSNCIDGKDIIPKTYQWFEDNLQEVVRNVALRNKNAERTASDGNDTSEIIIKNLEDRKKTAKLYGNVISVNLLQFEDVLDMPDPLMHILMGLTNDNLSFIRKDAKELDNNENQERIEQEIIDKVYENLTTKQDLELEYIENSREMKNMKKILKLLFAGQLKEAEIEAKNNYINKLKKKKQSRAICKSTFCLLFPIDIQEGYGRTVECQNGCHPHTLCEGLSDFSYPILLADEEYLCNKCQGFSNEEIDGKFQTEINNLDFNVKQLELEINSHLMEAKHLEQKQEKNIGEYEKMFTAGLKELHTEEQSYHGKSLFCIFGKHIILFLQVDH